MNIETEGKHNAYQIVGYSPLLLLRIKRLAKILPPLHGDDLKYVGGVGNGFWVLPRAGQVVQDSY